MLSFYEVPYVTPGGFLSVAEDGGTVYLGGSPDAEGEGGQEQKHGKHHLPYGYAEGNAQQHGHGRGEGNEREPGADVSRGLVDHGWQEQHGQQQGNGEGQGELLRVGVVIDKGACRRKERGVEQISEHEIEDKEQDNEAVVDVGEALDKVLQTVVDAFARLVLRGFVLGCLIMCLRKIKDFIYK